MPPDTEVATFLAQVLKPTADTTNSSHHKANHTPIQDAPDAPIQPHAKHLRLPASASEALDGGAPSADTEYVLRTRPAQPERFADSAYSRIGGYREREFTENPAHQRVRQDGESYDTVAGVQLGQRTRKRKPARKERQPENPCDFRAELVRTSQSFFRLCPSPPAPHQAPSLTSLSYAPWQAA